MLSQWNFNNSYLELPKIFFSKTKPSQFSNLELILKNQKLIDKLNLNRTKFDKFIVTSISDRKHVFYSLDTLFFCWFFISSYRIIKNYPNW